MVSAIDKMTLVKQASASLANATSAQRTEALLNILKLLLQRSDEIIAANLKDLERGEQADMTKSTQDRIRLDSARIAAIADSVIKVTTLPDVLGDVIRGMTLPNGLQISQVRVALGAMTAAQRVTPMISANCF